jgi:hypothetical protein
MSRLSWLSLAIVALSIAIVLTGRAALESDRVSMGTRLVAEVDALAGATPPAELSTRVTAAAECYPRLVPPDKACLYVWAYPSRADYLRLVASRLQGSATTAAVLWGIVAAIFWVVAGVLTWKAMRSGDPRAARRRLQQAPRVRPPSRVAPPRT